MDTTPDADDLWNGIAGQFDSITQVLCEFIDNSISNFEGGNIPHKTVYINLEEKPNDKISIDIEDAGTGITDFQPVLKIGDKSVRQSPLNEHGFGLKHSLATANPDNNSWQISTRTKKDYDSLAFRFISAPYSFSMDTQTINVNEKQWPGIWNGSGTVVSFECSKVLFDTVQKGIKGNAGFVRCLDYLSEELGYIYAGVIEKGKVSITVASKRALYSKVIGAVKPDWQDYYQPGSGSQNVDLGGGGVTIEYVFGEMKESSYVKHYKRNMSTSGVEIRINGRLMASNIFKDIWQIEEHPSYNHFLAIINLVSQDRNALPKTRTSKNGIRSGDERLHHLYEWIKRTHPSPHKDLAGAVSEKELVKELADLKEKHNRNQAKHIEREFRVFKSINSAVPVDLYAFDGHEVVLYEAKKGTADVQDIYQLLMYWDGAVMDGLTPNEGILIASAFSEGVSKMLPIINSMQDQQGNNYKFSTTLWSDENINYPKP